MINENLTKVFIFVAGAAVGSLVAWKLSKNKYERLIDEMEESIYTVGPAAVYPDEDDEIDSYIQHEYAGVLNNNNYNEANEEDIKVMNRVGPYVIPADDFDTLDDYDSVTYTYYADGILTDERDDVVNEEDIEDVVGQDAIDRFANYNDDSVYVRDDDKQLDYEILRDLSKYEDTHPENE